MKKSLYALLATLLFSAQASAITFNDPLAPIDLNTYVGGSFDGHDAVSFSVNVSNTGAGLANDFVHYLTFTITDPLSNLIATGFEAPVVFGGVTFTDLDPFTVTFYNMGANGVINGGDDTVVPGGASVDTVVTAGKYYMKVVGKTGGFPPYVGGVYAGGVSVSPVPEAETWAMMAAGLGLVGLQLRRRTRRKLAIN